MPGQPWAQRLLRWLEYPANLAFANVLWFVFTLPVITWLPATVALLHSLDRWVRADDDRVFRNFIAGWRRHWRRGLLLGLASTATAAVLGANALFLSTRDGTVPIVLLGGTAALAAGWLLLHLWLLPLMVLRPELSVRDWLAASLVLLGRNLLLSAVLAAFAVLSAGVFAALPTLLPFYGASVLGFLALRTAHRALGTGP